MQAVTAVNAIEASKTLMRKPTYRFYALYDKMYRADVLAHAYDCTSGSMSGTWKRSASRHRATSRLYTFEKSHI